MFSTTRADVVGAHHIVLGVCREKRALVVTLEGPVHPVQELGRAHATRLEHRRTRMELTVGGARTFPQEGVALLDVRGQQIEQALAAQQRPEAVEGPARVEQLEVVDAPAGGPCRERHGHCRRSLLVGHGHTLLMMRM
ncbi:hypothetical protein OKJ48_24135 [Streptomyces kunmingensis]|uniref:Uncharacterized protein n=1 Tax=Streptomyces kunmingensis TaxID=68225 RepID=A0ABU6CF32_9ACTN|nr:hypothetical protein [Streptomyces kunmingensis]MEB3963307.1 hypothetical protein [Streptomyces kunmingensis]